MRYQLLEPGEATVELLDTQTGKVIATWYADALGVVGEDLVLYTVGQMNNYDRIKKQSHGIEPSSS